MSQPPLQPFSNLLVVMTDRHIGNLLVSLYAIKAAQQQLSNEQTLSCVIDYHLLSLATYFLPDIEFIPCNLRGSKLSIWQKSKLFIKLYTRLKQLKIDTAVDLYGHGESLKIAQLSGANYISAFYSRPKLKEKYDWCDRDSDLTANHQIDFYRYPFYPLFGELTHVKLNAPKLDNVYSGLRTKLNALAVDQNRPLVVIHPGAGKTYKLWPTHHWQKLIAMLEQDNKQVLLIGAGVDKPEVEAIIKDTSIAPINGFGQFNLIETIHLGFICESMIGNDSGPTHLMATTPTYVYSLFGPTDDTLWSPLSDNSHILRSETPCLEACSKQSCARTQSCLQLLSANTVYQQSQTQA